MLNWPRFQADQAARGELTHVGEGSTRFLLGAAVGATTGFAAGFFVATPTARTVSKSTLGSVGAAARFVGRTALQATDGLGRVLEDGYTRVRGREKYLEHEIEQLREQITRLEQRMD